MALEKVLTFIDPKTVTGVEHCARGVPDLEGSHTGFSNTVYCRDCRIPERYRNVSTSELLVNGQLANCTNQYCENWK